MTERRRPEGDGGAKSARIACVQMDYHLLEAESNVEARAYKEALMTSFTAAWQDLQRELRLEGQGNVAEADRRQADMLWFAKSRLTQREIATCTTLSQPRITQLLRYHRFMITFSYQEISEFRFRAYWAQLSDPRLTKYLWRKPPEEQAAYEQQVFAAIAARIAAGTPPDTRPKPGPRPKTAAEIQAARDERRALREEVRRIHAQELKPALERFKGLRHVGQAIYAPLVLAQAAQTIERCVQHIVSLLVEAKDTRVDASDKPSGDVSGPGPLIALIGTGDRDEYDLDQDRGADLRDP
jgi:hypothetical protein